MTKSFFAALVILAASSAPTELWATCSANGGCTFSPNTYLNAHNKHRAKHCVPALKWDVGLAAGAQKWANNCVFKHSGFRGVGENLYYQSPQLPNPAAGIDDWYAEEDKYDYNTRRYMPAAGHFTQVIWKATTAVGCAVQYCPELDGGAVLMVCRYAPQGNMTFNGKWGGTANVPKMCR